MAIYLFSLLLIAFTHAQPGSYVTAAPGEICGCYDIDLMCDPIEVSEDEVCYYYRANRISTSSYCTRKLKEIVLNADDVCLDAMSGRDIRRAITKYAPACVEVDTCMNGNGITIDMIPDEPSTTAGYAYSGPKRVKGNKPVATDDLMVFSVCFNASAIIGTTSGSIGISIGRETETCAVGPILPQFCDPDNVPVSVPVVTPSPVTPSPTTPSPTTDEPTGSPSDEPTTSPSDEPTTSPSDEPTTSPSDEPTTSPSDEPTTSPSDEPTTSPSDEPTTSPSDEPTTSPSDEPTTSPSDEPTSSPSDEPTTSPSDEPTTSPSDEPTTSPSDEPTTSPSDEPTTSPSDEPTTSPSDEPTTSPSDEPTTSPSDEPTTSPSDEPTASPSDEPTTSPSDEPTTSPSDEPTTSPSDEPTTSPSDEPTTSPSDEPTTSPSDEPTTSPSDEPTTSPSDEPTTSPSDEPTTSPSDEPTTSPSDEPTSSPSDEPTTSPTDEPTTSPSDEPTASPSDEPTTSPSDEPTTSPSDEPTTSPTDEPTTSPSDEPTTSPSDEPTTSPSDEPTTSPTDEPSPSPTTESPTTAQPTSAPTYTECATEDALNIGFLLDESASVDINEWQIIKTFVNRIITFDISPVSSVKLWKYATYSFFQVIEDWTVNDAAGGKATLSNSILNNGYSRVGLTMTWDAMNRVLDDFWSYRYSCTDGCETRSDLLFLITDGAPTGEPVCPDMTARMNQSDVDVVLILIDNDGTFPPSLVDCLDVGTDKQDVYELPDFDSDAFVAIESRIREKTCNGNNPAGPGVRPVNGTQWRYADGSIGLGPVPEPERTGGKNGTGDAGTAMKNDDVIHDQQLKAHPIVEHDENADNDDNDWIYIAGGTLGGLLVIGVVIGVFIKMKSAKKGRASFNDLTVREVEVDGGKTGDIPMSPGSPKEHDALGANAYAMPQSV